MKVLHFSHTPLAGAPYLIVQCLRKYGDFEQVDLCNYTDRYADGRIFPTEKMWPINIHIYDIIHIHNQLPAYLLPELKKFKGKIFATLHSVPRLHNWDFVIKFVGKDRTFVIEQPYQINEYKNDGLKFLKTPIDIYNPIFNQKKSDTITINFAVSNKLGLDHPATKGYYQVRKVLDELKGVNVLEYSGKPHLEDLVLKAKSHIIIDDVVHDTFHLTSLFGLAGKSFVITGATDKTMKYYSPENPFITANLNDLKKKLDMIIEKCYNLDINAAGLDWLKKYWNPKEITENYYRVYKGI